MYIYTFLLRMTDTVTCKNIDISFWDTLYMKLEFSRQIFTEYLNIKFHKIRPIGAELFQADGQTDVTKLIVAFSNFANAPKKREVLEKTKAIYTCRQ